MTEGRAGYSCGGTPAPPSELTSSITGSKTDQAFVLTVGGKQVTIPIAGKQATKTFTNYGTGGYGAKVTYEVYCFTCE